MSRRIVDASRRRPEPDALRQLLEQARLGEAEVRMRLEQAVAPAYWTTLCPSLSIEGPGESADIEHTPIDDRHRDELLDRLGREGYFQTGPLVALSAVERMRRCVELVKSADWPPVFAFVYDEFWAVARAPSLARLLAGALGQGYRQVSQIWLHYVLPRAGASGWPPHFDGYRRGNRVTVWVPLTDATLDTGCMYLIPKNLIPPGTADAFARLEGIGLADAQALLQASRALPSPAGTVLGWDFEVIHWSSRCSRPGEPRIAFSQTFIGGSEQPAPDEVPLLDGHRGLPRFRQRLRTIAEAIRSYERFEVLLIRYRDLAERLIERAGSREGDGSGA